MKKNARRTNHRRNALVALALVVLAAVVAGVIVGYGQLRALWLEESLVRDVTKQVTVNSGRMVKGDVVLENLGVRRGANLALIDFDAARKEVLRRIPNLRAVSVTRYLPDRLEVVLEERVPLVRLNVHGARHVSGRVVDAEGVVFLCQRGTSALPTLYERAAPGTTPGHRVSGRARAALRLLEIAADPQYAELGVLDADVSKRDFILLTLGNYSRAKVAWSGMDGEATPETDAALRRQLARLAKAVRSRVGADALVWNATDTSEAGLVYADTKGNLR